MKQTLGRQETQTLAYLQMRKQRVARIGDLTGPLGLSRLQERRLLGRLARGRLIARVRRGLYLVPPQLPLGGSWTPSEALALDTLMKDQGARYQVTGPNAFNRYGFDAQVPNRVYAYNDRISGERSVGAVGLSLIKVAGTRLGDTEQVRTPDGLVMAYSSRARSLVDAVYDWARFASLPQGFDWIRTELATKRVAASELVRVTLRYGDVGTIRRMGALLDRAGIRAALLRKLEQGLKRSKSLIAWNPVRPKRGTVDRRWGVVWNDRV